MNEKKTEKKNRAGKAKSNVHLMWRFLRGSKAMFMTGIVFSALTVLADMIDPQIVRMAVDNALGGQKGDYSPAVMAVINRLGGFEYLGDHIWIMALMIVAVALVRVISQYMYRVYNTKGSETLVKTMRDTLFTHIEHLPFDWHMKNHTGDIIQRCTSDIDTLRNFVSEQLTSVFRIVILIVLSLVFMLSMNVKLTLIAFIPVPVVLVYAIIFFNKIGNGFQKCDENEGKLSAMAQENLTGVRVVRAFGREARERERFEAHNEYYTSLWTHLAKVLSFYWCSQDIFSGLQILLVVACGAVFCVRGNMTAGEYIAFISYNAMLTWPVRMLGRMISEMSKAGVSIGRIAEIMNAAEEEQAAEESELLSGDIVFDHVTFAYDEGKPVLHDVSFTLKAGQTLGILGGTGSGKSTLMLLLDRMYDLPEGCGRITIGGRDVRTIPVATLRRSIGYVMQEPFLFSRTLGENIAIATEKADSESIRAAARSACLDDAVMSFTAGYDTEVGERGVTLSGGQKQRTAIARTLIGNTPFMIFDDSLSAVDAETDARIRSELEKRFGSASIIIISHRISTLSKTDRILVLENGRIIEEGSHEELVQLGGIYRRICDIQSGAGEEA